MSTWVPTFKLYESDGASLVYTFPIVQYTNAPQTVKQTVVLKNLRGKGGIVIDGGEDTWKLELKGLHYGDDYESIEGAMNTMETTIVMNTKYVLKFNISESTYHNYNVKRIDAITYPESLRTDSQIYSVKFIANAW